jgi:hypothetical protein
VAPMVEGPSDPSVGEGLGRWECLRPTETRIHESKAHELCVAHGVRILECTKTPHLEV